MRNDLHKFASHHPSQESDWGFEEVSHQDKVSPRVHASRQDNVFQKCKVLPQPSALPQPKLISPDNKERGSDLVRSLFCYYSEVRNSGLVQYSNAPNMSNQQIQALLEN